MNRRVATVGLALFCSSCSAPIEPEKAPDRIVTTETEGGFNLSNPTAPPTSLGCVIEHLRSSGEPWTVYREIVDAQGRVVLFRYESDQGSGLVPVETAQFAYDDHGRIAEAIKSYGYDLRFVYTDHELGLYPRLSSIPQKRYHLDDQGLVEGRIDVSWSEPTYSVHWLDDVRPLEFTTSFTSRWTWDSEGFLSETVRTDGTSSCARRFSWERSDRAVTLRVRDAEGRPRWSGSYEFDAEGRMTRVIVGATAAVAWAYQDGWSIHKGVDGNLFRASAACHYPPSRKELARTLAIGAFRLTDEPRPTHIHETYDLPLPSTDCALYDE